MKPTPLLRPALVALLLFLMTISAWEIFLRSEGIGISFDDADPLWAHHRGRIYQPADQSTVIIGSSRIKFDLDTDTWKTITGDDPVQLACVGSSPLPVLVDLADDPDFRGKLIIDVTEGLFFSTHPRNLNRPTSGLKHYREATPAQGASFVLNKPLESTFVFLDKENYSLNALLDKLEIPSRPGVQMAPIFGRDFGRTKFSRQEYMGSLFLSDTHQINKQRAVWDLFRRFNRAPPLTGAPLDSLLQTVKTATDKIIARGGRIIFVRTPSSGPFLAGEEKAFPRKQYWDRILSTTGCQGIHFRDYPQLSQYECPEFSHLAPSDAIDFTKHLIDILVKEFGWSFPGMKHQ